MRKLAIILILLTSVISAGFAQNIDSVFIRVPNQIVWGLTMAQKIGLVTQSDSTVTDTLYSNIKRLKKSDDYINLQTSKAGNVQIKLLPLVNQSKIICVIKTVSAPASDSRISFYTTQWKPISGSKSFLQVDLKRFFKTDINLNDPDFKAALQTIDMNPIKLELSAENTDLSVSYDLKNYLSKEDYQHIEPYLTKDSLKMTWDKMQFVYKQ